MMNPVDQLMEAAVATEIFPGAALMFSHYETVLHAAHYGFATLKPHPEALEVGALFDVASLTKPLATTAIAMRLVERGILDLDAKLGDVLEVFQSSPYASVSVAQLLAHRSGLPAYRAYFEKYAADTISSQNHEKYLTDYLTWIAAETPEAAPGEQRIYSDLGFIVLGAVLEKVAVDNLTKLFEKEVVTPLSLKNSFYGPVDNFQAQVVSTEQDPWRGRLLCGEVHDENAFVLGTAGHAGVFTSLFDCHRLAQEYVKAGQGQSSWLSVETIALFLGSNRKVALGWDRPSQPSSQAGKYFPADAVGHLAFTGCSVWIDLNEGIVASLLSNRVHPHRDNDKIKQFRPLIHDALFEHYCGVS